MSVPDYIAPKELLRAETAITRYFRTAVRGTTVEHVLDPEYWAHTAERMTRSPNKGIGDEIRVRAEDGSFDIEVTVVAIDPRGHWAHVHLLREARHDSLMPAVQYPDKDGFTVEFAGPQRFRIIDRDGNIVEKDLPDRDTAIAKLAEIKGERPAPAPVKEPRPAKAA